MKTTTAYDNYGKTGFHVACGGINRTRILEVILNNEDSVNIDFKARTNDMLQCTGFEYAQMGNRVDVINLIRTKLPSGKC